MNKYEGTTYYYVVHKVSGTAVGSSSALGPKLYTSLKRAIANNKGNFQSDEQFFKHYEVVATVLGTGLTVAG